MFTKTVLFILVHTITSLNILHSFFNTLYTGLEAGRFLKPESPLEKQGYHRKAIQNWLESPLIRQGKGRKGF